jgi:hypothetical protein
MGTFSYALSEEAMDRLSVRIPGGTKAIAAAELRGRGLTVIAATLEGSVAQHVCGVIQPGRERSWTQTLDTDIVDLVKRRYFNLGQSEE